MNSTVDEYEIKQFNKSNQDWWDENGSFKSLHKITPCRLEYVFQVIKRNINYKKYNGHNLKGLNILDIGCGGGLLCEPLARLGGSVTGIDVSENAIHQAKEHSKLMGLEINYECKSIESFDRKRKKFDLIIASEVIEHVSNRKLFLKIIRKTASNETSLIITTINKSIPGVLFGKYAAEYIFNLIPKNTHDWNKFVKPDVLFSEAKESGILLNNFVGISPDLINKDFKLTAYLGINYAASGIMI